VKALPQKTVYDLNEDPNYTGLVISAAYDDGSNEDVLHSDYDLSFDGFDSTTSGEKAITVTYREKSASFSITVNTAQTYFLKEWADDELYYATDNNELSSTGSIANGSNMSYKLSISDGGETVEFRRMYEGGNELLFKLEGVTTWKPLSNKQDQYPDAPNFYGDGFALSGGNLTSSSAADAISYLRVYKGAHHTTNGKLYFETKYTQTTYADPRRYFGVMQ
jgi:hypothetical protein